MTYEEKRELRLQISQMLADAGINQSTLKEMVKQEISNKVERAVAEMANPNNEDGIWQLIKERIYERIDVLLKYGSLKSILAQELAEQITITVNKKLDNGE